MIVRLLLDEHLSPVIAEQLLARGVDVTSVAARPDLRTLPDPQILEAAASEGRVLVTRNIRDFVRLDAIWGGAGRSHPGILFVGTRRFPENRSLIGTLTTALVQWAEAEHDISGAYWFL